MTAVALLMAIFQFRPSPFCVLDEVDAPFDEANIGRFVEVLKSFLHWTKFIIVTHSKKTMTAADTPFPSATRPLFLATAPPALNSPMTYKSSTVCPATSTDCPA